MGEGVDMHEVDDEFGVGGCCGIGQYYGEEDGMNVDPTGML